MAFALITGASGGIGLSLARELAQRKIDLLLVARSEDKLSDAKKELEEKYKVKVEFLSCDLSKPGSVSAITDWITKNSFPVNILVNNAGYGIWGTVENTPWVQLSNMMQLNMVTLAELCHAMLPGLKKHSQSYILNV